MSVVGELSKRGRCFECAMQRTRDNALQLQARRGPYAQYWAHQLAASVGLAPLDEGPPQP
jgi:hypothetical protein